MPSGLDTLRAAAEMPVIEARLSAIAAEIAASSQSRTEALDRCVHTAIGRPLDTEDFVTLVEEVERLSGWRLGSTERAPLY